MKQLHFNRILLSIGTMFLLVCCTRNNKEPLVKVVDKVSIVTERAAIKSTLVDMWDALEKEDLKRYASYIHPDFTQFGETDPTLNIGKKIELEGVKSWLENVDNVHTEMLDPLITVRDSTAWITYYWQDHGLTAGEPFASKGKSTRIFVKEKGRWMCIHGHYTLLE